MYCRGVKFDRRISRLCVCGGKLDHSMLPRLLNEDGGSELRIFWINEIGQVSILLVHWNNEIDKISISLVH